ncbi:MAG: glycosyltransferase family 4 protein [Elusimicrobiales bacterium]|nr:glycosyltransferase family 4 protein [Elusimicrobiales bacterium]
MKRQLKILNIIDIPWYSGLSDYAFAQSDILEKAGHIIYFACPKNSLSEKLAKEKGYKTINIQDRKKILNPFIIIKLINFIRKEGIDILNAHTGKTQSIAYIISFFCHNIKIIRTKADTKKATKSFTYSRINLIICGSKYIKDMFSNINNKKSVVIYKSIILPEYKPIVKEKPFKIGILGRLDPVKGHIYFIKAAVDILSKGYNCNFFISGKEANIKWNELLELIPDNFKYAFTYSGYVDDVYKFISDCHIGVISSISSEAVSRVAIEWMSSGRLVISSNVGCLGEFVSDEYIVPRMDSYALSKKIIEKLDFNIIEKAGLENLQRIKNNFSYEKFYKETLSVFEELVY